MAAVPTVDLTSDDPAEVDLPENGRTDVQELEQQLCSVEEELLDVSYFCLHPAVCMSISKACR